MTPDFLTRLKQTPVLCDGAMGTLLYAKGIFINRSYDELNLSQPDLIRGIHHEYRQAGAEIIEPNTFGAGLQILVVNSANQVGLGKIQFVIGTIDENALGVEQGSHGAITQHRGLLEPRKKVRRHDSFSEYRIGSGSCISMNLIWNAPRLPGITFIRARHESKLPVCYNPPFHK